MSFGHSLDEVVATLHFEGEALFTTVEIARSGAEAKVAPAGQTSK